MKHVKNQMRMSFVSRSSNEGFSRAAVAAFVLPLDPTVAEISDLKTSVSEAVTNAIVHAYPDTVGTVYIEARITDDDRVIIKIRDKGIGIPDIAKAMEPLYTTSSDERAGLGFAVMQSFCDKVRVRSAEGKGTTVTLEKQLHSAYADQR